MRRSRGDGPTWYARWRDPVTRQVRDTNLTKLGLTTRQQRVRWAETKSASLREVAARVAAGGAVVEEELAQAAQSYLAAKRHEVRAKTLASYEDTIDPFAAWAVARGLRYVHAIDRATLFAWRAALAARPDLEPVSVNSHLVRTKVALNWWRREGKLPQLDELAIKDALRAVPAPRPDPNPLQPEQLAELVEAAPAEGLPVVLLYLLSGMRAGEGLALEWTEVHAHEIRLGAWVKTRIPRSIDLDVSPALAAALEALRRPKARRVLEDWSADGLRRLRSEIRRRGGPAITWKQLRQTCGSYLTCAPGIYGGASAFRSARQLGHSVEVAERHYVGRVRPPRDATTLEAAMGIATLLPARGLQSCNTTVGGGG